MMKGETIFETVMLAQEKGLIPLISQELHIIREISNLSDEDVKYVSLCEVQKWLRDKHKLHVFPDHWNSGDEPQKWGWSISSLPLDGKGGIFKCQSVEEKTAFKTYEEALEAGLKEALILTTNRTN